MVVHFSYKRYKKDMADIKERENKAKAMLKKGDSYVDRAKSGKFEYIKKCGVDENGKSTGKPPAKRDKKYTYELNTKAIEKQRKCAGYYAFITNIPAEEESAHTLYKKLRSLWKIENFFREMKSTLHARPVFVRTEKHIRGHFMMCYLALIIEDLCLKEIKTKLDPSFSSRRLKEFLKEDSFVRILAAQRSTTIFQKLWPNSEEEGRLYDKIYQDKGAQNPDIFGFFNGRKI